MRRIFSFNNPWTAFSIILTLLVLISLQAYRIFIAQIRQDKKDNIPYSPISHITSSLRYWSSDLSLHKQNISSNSTHVQPQLSTLIPSYPTTLSPSKPPIVHAAIYSTSPSPTNSPTLHRNTIGRVKSTSSPTISAQSCQYDFKVYVYPIPKELPSYRIAAEARTSKSLHVCQKCILEQFSLEYIIFDFFTQFCGRTYDPLQADFFYLPIIRDAEYRVALSNGGNRVPSSTESALLALLEKKDSSLWRKVFNVTDEFWWEKSGSDHIIAMAAPVTNFRHESGMRGFFHYMSHLFTPIFINVEYTTSFVREYPICATRKNIVVPYPTTDPDFYSGKLFNGHVERSALLYYAGGLHGDCVEVRQAMHAIMKNGTRIPGIVPKVRSNQAEREHGFRAAKYCPVPIGDSPSSKRMYDVLNFGCVPVVLSDDLVWAFSHETNGPINQSTFAIHIPQAVVQFPASRLLMKYKSSKESFGVLPKSGLFLYDILATAQLEDANYVNGVYVNPLIQILLRIPEEDLKYLQQGGSKIAPLYQYYAMNDSMKLIPTETSVFPNGGAIRMLAESLSLKKKMDVVKILDDCLQEKARKHRYVGRYPCDKNIRRRLEESDSSCYWDD